MLESLWDKVPTDETTTEGMLETEEEIYTWEIPELLRGPKESPYQDCWYVSRQSQEKYHHTSDTAGYPKRTEYLASDNNWRGSMKAGSKGAGGTYFKTLAEAIAVLAEFEIDVM